MAELSDEELLLLSTLIYEDKVASGDKNIVDVADLVDYYKELKDEGWAAIEWRGDFGHMQTRLDDGEGTRDPQQEFMNILSQIEANPDLMELEIKNPVLADGGRDGITAVCFVDPDDGTATVAIRGTDASYVSWKDNFEQAGWFGMTPMERATVDYINGLPYTDITTTGHSKGGHLAAVSAILCDNVSSCKSFDGQGCSEAFILIHGKAIAENKDKITTYAAHNDFVHGLLFSISGQTIYVENNADCISEGHYVTNLSRDNVFDENGNFISICEQSEGHKILFTYLDSLILLMPPGYEERFTDFIGTFAALILGKDNINPILVLEDFVKLLYTGAFLNMPIEFFVFIKYFALPALALTIAVIVIEKIADVLEQVREFLNGLIEEFKQLAADLGEWAINAALELGEIIKNFLDSVGDWLNETFNDGYKYATANPYFKVDTAKLRAYADRLTSVQSRLKSLDSRLDTVKSDLSGDDYFNLCWADAEIGTNKVVKEAIAYLNDTANEFEVLESHLIAQLGS